MVSLICSFAFSSFSCLQSAAVQKQGILLIYPQMVTSSLMSGHRHSPHFIPSLGILSSQKGESSAIKYFESDHIHVIFITVYYNCFIIIVFNLLPCLIYKVNFILHMYVQEKKTGCIHGVWYYLWFPVLEHIFLGQGVATV